jgi:thioredoxin 2
MVESLHIVCPSCDQTNRVPTARLGTGGKCGRCGAALFTGRPVPLDDERFDKHARVSDIPLLVDFWAEWCGPCRMMAPVFEQAATQLEPRVRLVKVDTESARATAGQFRIHSIPSLILVRHGTELARTAGAMPLSRLVDWTRAALGERAA